MSWSIEEHIGECRPWPEQVVVYRGETDESLTYARRSLSDVNKMVELMDTLAAENAKLREMLAEENEELAKMRRVIDYLYFFVKSCGVDAEDMRELGVGVSE